MQVNDWLWFTRDQAAELCGFSTRQFDDTARAKAVGAERGKAKTLRFHGPKIVAGAVAYRLEQGRISVDGDGDPLMTGSDSPNLERYRLGKAQMIELDLAERQKILVRADVLDRALRPAITAMRQTGDRLVRKFGNEAGEIFNEGVSEFEAAALQYFASDTSDDGGRDDHPPPTNVADADAAAADPG